MAPPANPAAAVAAAPAAAPAGRPPALADEHADAGRLISALGIAQIVAWGSTYYVFALLLQPLQAALGVDSVRVVGAFCLGLVVAGLAAPWVGRRIDARGGRPVMLAGTVATALLLAAHAQVTSLAALYAIWAALGLAMAATLYEPAFAVLTQTFRTGYRRAITLLTLFGGFASTVFWPLNTALIAQFGWRRTLLILAAAQLAVNLPLLARALPRHRQAPAAAAAPRAASALWRDPLFVCFAGALLLQSAAITALSVHLLTMLVAQGLSAAAAALIGALIGPMQVAGRLAEMRLGGRRSALRVGRLVVLLLPAALLCLWLADTGWLMALAFAVLYGAGNGVMTIVRGAAPVELWGHAQYGQIVGMLAVPAMLARAAGPLLAAALWLALGSYDAVILVLAAFAVVAAVLFFRVGRGTPAVQPLTTA